MSDNISIERLVQHRHQNLDYFKRLYSTNNSTTHWLNCSKLTPIIIQQYHCESIQNQLLIQNLLILSISLGRLLSLDNGLSLVNAGLILMKEYKQFINNNSNTNNNNNNNNTEFIRIINTNTAASTHSALLYQPTYRPLFTSTSSNNNTVISINNTNNSTYTNTTIGNTGTGNNNTIIHYLQSDISLHYINLLDSIDPIITILSLCDTLNLIYSKLLDYSYRANNSNNNNNNNSSTNSSNNIESNNYYQSIIKFDELLVKYIISIIGKELNTIADQLVKKEIESTWTWNWKSNNNNNNSLTTTVNTSNTTNTNTVNSYVQT